MSVSIEPARAHHVAGRARLRALLWADETVEEHRAAILASEGAADLIAFVAVSADEVVGFVEASIRRDHVNGCDTSPVAFLEGLMVDPTCPRRGTARALVAAVAAWGRTRGCSELGSDTDEENVQGQALHRRLGFEERERVVFYRKLL